MKGLTLTQPWASLVERGEKRIETRGWGTNYRGRLAIHAAKGVAPIGGETGYMNLVSSSPFWDVLRRDARPLPRGAVVAFVDVIACIPTKTLDRALAEIPSLAGFKEAEHEREFGDYTPGRYAWLLDNLFVPAEPIVHRGAQGLWHVEEDEYWAGF